MKSKMQNLAVALPCWAKKPARAWKLVIMACSESETRREGVEAAWWEACLEILGGGQGIEWEEP